MGWDGVGYTQICISSLFTQALLRIECVFAGLYDKVLPMIFLEG